MVHTCDLSPGEMEDLKLKVAFRLCQEFDASPCPKQNKEKGTHIMRYSWPPFTFYKELEIDSVSSAPRQLAQAVLSLLSPAGPYWCVCCGS